MSIEIAEKRNGSNWE